MRALITLIFIVSCVLGIQAWSMEGPARLPDAQYSSAHAASLFRQRLLSAFRTVNPDVSENVLQGFQRYYRNPQHY